VIEARNAQKQQFGGERLMQELERAGAGGLSVLEIRDQLCGAVTQFMDEQDDDIALLVARYRKPA
jgi:serine phosphatase RsbU (regulator of sigma subunit)